MKIAGIYMIKNKINNKVYIGSSNNTRHRWIQHLSYLRRSKHHSIHLQNSWNKYGEDNFEFIVIECMLNEDILAEREQFWLDYYRCYEKKNGYNVCLTVGVNGMLLPQESIEKMRKSLRQRRLDGHLPHNVKLTEEQALISYWLYKNTGLTAKEIGSYFGVKYATISGLNVNNWTTLDFDNFKLDEFEEYFMVNEVLKHNNQLTLLQIKEIKLLHKLSNIYLDDLAELYNLSNMTIQRICKGNYRFDVDISEYDYLPYYLEELNYRIVHERDLNVIKKDYTQKIIVYLYRNNIIPVNKIQEIFNMNIGTIRELNRRYGNLTSSISIPFFYQNLIKLNN